MNFSSSKQKMQNQSEKSLTLNKANNSKKVLVGGNNDKSNKLNSKKSVTNAHPSSSSLHSNKNLKPSKTAASKT